MMLELVSATRLSESDFGQKSPLGLSLRRLSFDQRIVPRVAFGNSQPLGAVFNSVLENGVASEWVAFVHDDVWIEDFFLPERLSAAFNQFELVGVAGNRRRVLNQPSWAFVDAELNWDVAANLAGSIAHGNQPFGQVGVYGPVPAACELIDGVFLAARKKTFLDHQIRFDPQFEFHFYDMDLCRQFRQKGLRIGVWPICLTHKSGGAFGSPEWSASYQKYLQKWGS